MKMNKTIDSWGELTFNALNEMGLKIMDTLPNVLGAIIILILGWLITKGLVLVLKKILLFSKVDLLTDAINDKELFGKINLKFNVSSVILAFVKWILFLVFLIVASDIMNWEIISLEIGNLLRYLPRLFSAIALFVVGVYVANFIRKAIKELFDSFDLMGGKIVSSLAFYVIAILITVSSLNQAGIETQIISDNLTIILGAFLGAIAIGFGFGSKEVITDLLKTFYARKNYEIGQKITVNGSTGEILAIDNISVVLKTENGKIVLPINEVVNNKVEVEN